jgi:rod shape-determining protein MreC
LHDKQIRRRRAVLVLLVVISLALLTDYFGESPNSPLHSIQRGIATVLSPLQSGASTVLSPVRDVAGYISSTVNAKSQLKRTEAENNSLKLALAQAQLEANQYKQADSIGKLDTSYSLQSYGLKTANVIGEDPILWYKTITIDEGSSGGVKLYDPVVAPGGLVGDVTRLMPDESVVTLITAPNFSVGAMIESNQDSAGLLQPQVGNPNTLMLNDLPASAANGLSSKQLVVTSGFEDPNDPSIRSAYPPGIPIGTVTGTNPQNSVLTNEQVEVAPLVDFQHLSLVQVLTRPHLGS